MLHIFALAPDSDSEADLGGAIVQRPFQAPASRAAKRSLVTDTVLGRSAGRRTLGDCTARGAVVATGPSLGICHNRLICARRIRMSSIRRFEASAGIQGPRARKRSTARDARRCRRYPILQESPFRGELRASSATISYRRRLCETEQSPSASECIADQGLTSSTSERRRPPYIHPYTAFCSYAFARSLPLGL